MQENYERSSFAWKWNAGYKKISPVSAGFEKISPVSAGEG
jgi:hypothetical protein